MSVQIAKAVRKAGEANGDGASFLASHLMNEVQQAYFAAQETARERGMPIGNAKVKILVEQEFIQVDLPGEGEN